MDTDTLVKERFDAGLKVLTQLVRNHFDVTAACWAKNSESNRWYLYIASKVVDEKDSLEAYRAVNDAFRSIGDPWDFRSQVKLISPNHHLARDLVKILQYAPDRILTLFKFPGYGSEEIEEVYIYPPDPERYWPRQAFTVSYHRQPGTNTWLATTERGKRLRGIKAKGVVTYMPAPRRSGETDEDEMFAIVGVYVEIDPDLDDDEILDRPNVRKMLAEQASKMADERFKSKHPDAIIEHPEMAISS